MTNQPSATTRRRFLKTAAGLSAAPLFLRTPLSGAAAPSNRLNLAFVGTGNQGMNLLRKAVKLPEARVIAVCDVNRGSFGYKEEKDFYGRQPAQKLVNDAYGNKDCAASADFREVFARPDVDAVFLVVPDHWHAPLTVLAAAAGKDIYCEKPLSLTVVDGREMETAVRKHGRVLQTGSHERSNPISRFVCETVRHGAVGEVKRVVTTVGYNNKVGPGPGWTPEPVPRGFDYETWLGPAPAAPYHHDRCLYRFRFNYDYSGGQITNFGAHSNDMAQWGLGMDGGGPVEVECLDAKFLPQGSLFNTATETKFRCRYANGVELLCVSGPEQVQTRFEGTDGWIETGYKGTRASRDELINNLPEKTAGGLDANQLHMRNFFKAIKTRKDPVAPVEVGRSTANLCHVGNAAIRLFGQTGKSEVLKWDAQAERFANSDAANGLLDRRAANSQ